MIFFPTALDRTSATTKDVIASLCSSQLSRHTKILSTPSHIMLSSTVLKPFAAHSTGYKPHRCQFPGCNQSFADPSSCSRHKKEMHEGETHRCPSRGCDTQYVLSVVVFLSFLTVTFAAGSNAGRRLSNTWRNTSFPLTGTLSICVVCALSNPRAFSRRTCFH
jgi:hypothetical protein